LAIETADIMVECDGAAVEERADRQVEITVTSPTVLPEALYNAT